MSTTESRQDTWSVGSGERPPRWDHPGRWWSIRDIAADLGISVSTAYKWSSRGQPDFPRSVRLRNGEIRVRDDWYEEWLSLLEN